MKKTFLSYGLNLLLAICIVSCSSESDDAPTLPTPEEMGEYVPGTLGQTPVAFDPTTLFTDKTCSELKADITDKDIQECKVNFYKNIATYLKAGKYPKEFRIQEYKAYPHPTLQSEAYKTSPYSLLDNPTGMTAEANKELVILVGDLNGKSLQLCIQNLNAPNKDGFNSQQVFQLREGMNKFTPIQGGLMYILYHSESYQTDKPIKIHIPSGHVNGYFDTAKHQASDWQRLLKNSTSDYFDVLGKYAHITFPTKDFRQYTPDGKKLIDAYDKIVESEMLLMGLFKYKEPFRNRMYFNVTYTGYMYATAFHTAYHEGTMPELCNVDILTSTSLWGPCHEVGHCNQTRPGLKWHGTTEVTNNIMSMYLQTSIFGNPSYLQTNNLKDGSPNLYAKAWTEIMAAKAPHAHFESNDVFCKLVPFWQLELYFGNVLERTPLKQDDKGGFYPDVYEYVRQNPDLSTAGEQQTEFVYICSKIAGMNLVKFFQKWGFLTPVNVISDDYGKEQMKVTQERIDEIIARIEALNLPQPDVALEYITDNNVEYYKTKDKVTEGQARRDGRSFTIWDWENVAAYEVVDTNGEAIFISEGKLNAGNVAQFTIRTDWQDGFKVYAISATGERTEVKL